MGNLGFTGRTHTEETKARIRAALVGRPLTPEQCESRSRRMKGRKPSEQAYAALRTPQIRDKRLAALRAAFALRPKKARPIRARRRVAAPKPPSRTPSEARRQWWLQLTQEQRTALAQARSQGQKRRWAAIPKDRKLAATEAGRRAAAAKARAEWATLSEQQRLVRMRPVWKAALTANPSSIERIVASALSSMGVEFIAQHPVGPYMADFFVPSAHVVIECDGAYWHSRPGRREKDAARDAHMKSIGVAVIRLPEADIRAGRFLDALAKVASHV